MYIYNFYLQHTCSVHFEMTSIHIRRIFTMKLNDQRSVIETVDIFNDEL